MVDQQEVAGHEVRRAAAAAPLKICLAGSGGGHVRQLLDLQPIWSKADYFFITEDTALGHSLRGEHRTYFVPHFAWGQAKAGAVFHMLGLAVQSLVRSARVMFSERPDLVISTGAGAVIFAVLWGRLIGARVIVIESFARFDKPSLFGRMAAPFAHEMVIQSKTLAPHYPRAHVFDPFRMLQTAAPAKQPLLFATVGATLPFERLVRSVTEARDRGAIPERIVVQTGEGGARPEGMEAYDTLPFAQVQALLTDASIVVCHGGTGSLITALRQGCHVIAIPRLAELGEHYDDHQAQISDAFSRRGLIQVANSVDELCAALAATKGRERVLATTEPQALMAFLLDQIKALAARKGRRLAA